MSRFGRRSSESALECEFKNPAEPEAVAETGEEIDSFLTGSFFAFGAAGAFLGDVAATSATFEFYHKVRGILSATRSLDLHNHPCIAIYSTSLGM